MDDDDARKAFLAPLIEALGADWNHEYEVVDTFDVLALVLRHRAIEVDLEVIPSVVWNNVVSWKPFPGNGQPHFDIRIDGGTRRTWVLNEAVGIIERSVRAQMPVARTAPTSMLATMRPILEAIARAPAVELDIERGLEAIGAELDLDKVHIAFPRDDDGRLKLGAQVLLKKIPERAAPKGRAVYATLRGPRARRDGNRVELGFEDALIDNASHAWCDAPWLWRHGAVRPPLDQAAHACVALLDAGRFEEALARYDVRLSERIIRVLEKATASPHAADDEETLRRALWHLAPWQLRGVGGRLTLLPHQTRLVKAWIALHNGVIDIESTGSNARLSEIDWKRSIQTDLDRLEIPRLPVAHRAPTTKKDVPQKTLTELLEGADLRGAVQALEAAKRRPLAEARVELLAVGSGSRAYALWILSEIGSEEDGETLFTFVEDPDPEVRRAALDGVGRLRYAAAIPALARIALADPHGGALLALQTMSGKRGAFGIVAYLDHEDPRVREAACRGLRTVGQAYKKARAGLQARLSDPDAAVAKAAAEALARIVQ